MAYNWRKQATVAYSYCLTRLALNFYLYFDELPSDYGVDSEMERKNDEEFMSVLGEWLHGELPQGRAAGLRGRLQEEMEAAISDIGSFNIYDYVLNRVERRFTKNIPGPDMEEAELVGALLNYVGNAQDTGTMNLRIQNIIGELPVRFTRQKYFSMVHDALSSYVGSDKGSLDYMMYLLKTNGMAGLVPDEDPLIPKLQEIKDGLGKLNFRDMAADDFFQARQQVSFACDMLFTVTDYYKTMQEMVNDLYVLCLTREDAMRDAAEEEHAYRIMDGLFAQYEGGSREIPEEVERELYYLEGIQEKNYEKYLRMDPAPEYHEGEDGTAYTSRCVERLLSGSPFAPLEETGIKGSGPVTQKDVDVAFDELVREQEPLFKASQKPVARAVMAETLSNLPICFNSLDEIRDYIKNSLSSCTDCAEKEASMVLLEQLLESGYDELV